MAEPTFLRDLVVLVGLAIPVLVLANRLAVPAIVGFLIVGVAIGPHGFALIHSPDSVAELSELGIVLLLFALGLELSLSALIGSGRELLQGGLVQVGGTLVVTAAIVAALGAPLTRAIFYGAIVAQSSTALLTKLLSDRTEVDTPHGRVVISILLFQDLSIVPLMLLIPILGGEAADGGMPVTELLLSLGVVAALVVGGRLAVPWILDRIVVLRDRELFTLCVGVLGLGAAYVTWSFGLSLAIGAFIAGLLISESEYGLQALSDVLPFRTLFSGIFFTSVGMLLDPGLLLAEPLVVAGLTLSVIVVKAVVCALAVLSVRRTLQTSVTAGLSLAQVGEFAFVLAAVGVPLGLFAGNDYQRFLSASVVTMLLTPMLVAGARPLAGWIEGLRRAAVAGSELEPPPTALMEDHAIIVGYGLAGRYLSQVFRAAAIPHVVLEQNGQLVRQARAENVPVVFGDGTRREVLEDVGLARARVILFVISSPIDERRGIAVARELNPHVRIIVRTRYVRAIEDLERLGASEVVVEEFESSLELFVRVLEGYEIPSNRIWQEVNAVRNQHYAMLRGKARPDLKLDALKHLGIHTALELVEVEDGSEADGQSATSLHLRQRTGAIQIAVVRDGKAIYRRDAAFRFQPGDTTVLVGDKEALERATALFRKAG